jgi:hypothetical protein
MACSISIEQRSLLKDGQVIGTGIEISRLSVNYVISEGRGDDGRFLQPWFY